MLPNGALPLGEILQQFRWGVRLVNPSNTDVTLKDITACMTTVSKNRYQLICMKGQPQLMCYMRALQAHGVGLHLDDASIYRPLHRAETPPFLYHCTQMQFLREICEHGLYPGGRVAYEAINAAISAEGEDSILR